ncbi:hypothetical protein [Pseudofrankia sp. BMG5.37]|uniref:hypothetical protein n=1 Tax=Pseudofrankia sp. BMG5.37 TaxID=3050035 RepID=UPI002895F780|nr:hypothetical protein [Pseudofrankia sp. BMG5.37]MDT3444450.1 hypothetical protein [Pseudofrankia sp. BMG5.37]
MILTTGAVVRTIDDPRFATGTVLRAFDRPNSGIHYEIQPHDAPLPPVLLHVGDVVPVRSTAWPTLQHLLDARATAGLPLQPGELLTAVREAASILDSPDGPRLGRPFPVAHPASPALNPTGQTPIAVDTTPLHPASHPHQGHKTGQAPTLRQIGDTIALDDPVHGHLEVPADLFHTALRHHPTDLDALLTRRPWLLTTNRPLLVKAALAAQHAATDLTPPTDHQPSAPSADGPPLRLVRPPDASHRPHPTPEPTTPPEPPTTAPPLEPGP